jgi:hypothetical protein
VACLTLALTGPGAAVAGTVPSPAEPLCLLTTDELNGITGLDFERVASGERNCSYAGGVPAAPYSIDFSLPDTDLLTVSAVYSSGGEDTTITGLPGWLSDDGIWVDFGDRILAVLPVFFFADDTPRPRDVLPEIAAMAVPRLAAVPSETPAATAAADGLANQFPAEIGGNPLEVTVVSGDELASQLAAQDPARAGALRAAVEAQGRTLADLTFGFASILNPGSSMAVFALQIAGGSAAPLLEIAPTVFTMFAEPTAELVSIAGRDVLALTDLADPTADPRYLLALDDVLWIVDTSDETLRDEAIGKLP